MNTTKMDRILNKFCYGYLAIADIFEGILTYSQNYDEDHMKYERHIEIVVNQTLEEQ